MLGVLFSGGKDSCYSAYLAKQKGHNLACLISLDSENKDSFMFHTPAISLVGKQAEVIGLPLILQKTKGEKEKELDDLERAIKLAVKKYKIEGVVSGAVESVYQASRIQKICNKLKIECFNPLWQKNQIELLNDLIKSKFEIILSGVFAYPLNEKWIGRKIDKKFIEELKMLKDKWGINPAGEGGEFESFVVNCPLFNDRIKIRNINMIKEGENSFRGEIEI